MKARPTITSIELVQFEHELKDMGREPTIGVPIYEPGSNLKTLVHAIRIHTDAGLTGDYVGGPGPEYAGVAMFASSLIGRNALEWEEMYNDIKQAMRQQARMGLVDRGHGIRLDIASSNFPRFDVNPNTGEPMGRHTHTVKALNTLYLDRSRPSHIVLPIIPEV